MPVTNFNYQLTWKDFQQLDSRPLNKNEDAQMELDLAFKTKHKRKGNAHIVSHADVTVVFKKCWVVKSKMTFDSLLKHEQGHFDIFAIGAREFHNNLFKLSAKSESDLDKSVKKLAEESVPRVMTVEYSYDNRTDHSTKADVQKTWEQKIDAAKKNPKGTIKDLPS